MITFGYDCPYCLKENVCFEVANFVQREYDHIPINIYAILATCNHCGKGIVANCGVENQARRDAFGMAGRSLSSEVFEKLKHHHGKKYQLEEILGFMPEFEPKKPEPDIPANLPQAAKDKMRGAEKLYFKAQGDLDMVEYSGTAYRKTLEIALAILDHNTDKNLNMRINQLVSNGILVKSMGDFAHSIRSLGNDATHNEISMEELEQLRLFTQLFLQYAFTLPAMIPDKIQSVE